MELAEEKLCIAMRRLALTNSNFESEAMKSLRATYRNIPMSVFKDLESKKSVIESMRSAHTAFNSLPSGVFESLEAMKQAQSSYSNVSPVVLENLEVMRRNGSVYDNFPSGVLENIRAMQPTIDIANGINLSVADRLKEIMASMNAYNNFSLGRTSNFEGIKLAIDGYNNIPRNVFHNFDVMKSAMASYNRMPSEIFTTIPEIFRYSNTFKVPELSRMLRDITFDETSETIDHSEKEELPYNVLDPVYAEWIYILFPIGLVFYLCGFDMDASVKNLLLLHLGAEYGKVFGVKKKDYLDE